MAEAADSFDLAVVGGGILGLLATLEARRRRPQWRLLVLERSEVGGGATGWSAALEIPFGRDSSRHRLAKVSFQAYGDLWRARPELPFRSIPFYGVVEARHFENVRKWACGTVPREATPWDRDQLTRIFPGWRLRQEELLLAGVEGRYCRPRELAMRLAQQVREERRSELFEGTEVKTLREAECGSGTCHELRIDDGRRIYADRVLVATGPWALRGPAGEVARRAGIRVKKIVALHLDHPVTPEDPVIYFFAEDAFLLPLFERQQWLFSFTCEHGAWDCEPDVNTLRITEEDRRLGIEILEEHVPGLASAANGGRVFCDAYGPGRAPVIEAAAASPPLVIAGAGSGSGFRLAPAMAREAVDLLLDPRATKPFCEELMAC